jgi:hypothetical protein
VAIRVTPEKSSQNRSEIRVKIRSGVLKDAFGFVVEAPIELANDPTGDQIDALLCAMQAAWAWSRRDECYGAPKTVDPLEGWIADPTLVEV